MRDSKNSRRIPSTLRIVLLLQGGIHSESSLLPCEKQPPPEKGGEERRDRGLRQSLLHPACLSISSSFLPSPRPFYDPPTRDSPQERCYYRCIYAREKEEEGSLKICPPDIKLSQKAEEGRREKVYAELSVREQKRCHCFYDGLEHNIDHGLAFEAGKSEATIPKKARFADDSACMISKQSSNRPPPSSSK